MELHVLPALSLPLLMQDVLVAIVAGAALLAGLAFINLGILLPGLLASLGGSSPEQRREFLEFGPRAAPLISEPRRVDRRPQKRTATSKMLCDHSSGATS